MSNQNKKKTKTMEMGFQVDAPPSNDNISQSMSEAGAA